MLSDEDFAAMIRVALLTEHLEDLADRLLVSRPTIARWARGESLPHPAVRKSIEMAIEQNLHTQPG
jgi:transcriptional regulator with XRE-family HTH domain